MYLSPSTCITMTTTKTSQIPAPASAEGEHGPDAYHNLKVSRHWLKGQARSVER